MNQYFITKDRIQSKTREIQPICEKYNCNKPSDIELLKKNAKKTIEVLKKRRMQNGKNSEHTMEALKCLKNKENLNWEYDSEADVLYISIGEPLKALTLDFGDGLLVRYLDDSKEVVGITLIGFQEKTLKSLVVA